MHIDIVHFTPWRSLSGGLLLGLAAAVLYLGIGRVAGVSGIFGKLVCDQEENSGWRLAFLVGLIVAAPLWQLMAPATFPEFRLDIHGPLAWTFFVVAGLLVGFGSRMANGCTSGHGICGLARFSGRSLVAVSGFMVGGIGMVYVIRHVFGSVA